jgi:ribonuclease P protein component
MKGEMHLKKSGDFALVHNQGKWLGNRLLGIKSIPNGLSVSRWGIITSKRLGKAVVRNFIKRRLREIMRDLRLRQGNDIILIGRAGIVSASYLDIKNNVLRLLMQDNLLETHNENNCNGND